MCGQTFCPQLQQTFAAIRSGLDSIITDVNDSEVFFQAAGRASNHARDNTRRVEELLARMTLEEQVHVARRASPNSGA